MKIIDLLNKIANGEEKPKIKFNNSIYEYHDKEHGYCRYYHDNTYICLETDYYWFDILNDEVEILEEEKKIPEKLNLDTDDLRGKETPRAIDYLIEDKINQVIDYLKSKGE